MGKNREVITGQIFNAYLNCRYKPCLRLNNHIGQRTEYEIIQEQLDKEYYLLAKMKIKSYYTKEEVLCLSNLTIGKLRLGKDLVLDTMIFGNGLQASYDALKKKCPEKSKLGSFSYEPVSFCRHQKIKRIDKLILVFKSVVLANFQGLMPQKAYLICGTNFSKKTIHIAPHLKTVEKMIADLRGQMGNAKKVPIFLNDHCNVCEFSGFCKSEATKNDHLSLLGSISEKEVSRCKKKGIETVNQLSYTFRPRKKAKRIKRNGRSWNYPLQAVAIREKSIYVLEQPALPSSKVKAYVDVEGDPDRSLYYLIGLIISEGNADRFYSFWADDGNQVFLIFSQLLAILSKYDDLTIFHYGAYETRFFKKMLANEKYVNYSKEVLSNSVNILSTIYYGIYFPTYSNGLKEVARYCGFKWSDNEASGVQSLVWRRKWERNHNNELKQKLITYNREDCLALKKVTELLYAIRMNANEQRTKVLGKDVILVPDVRFCGNRHKWGTPNFFSNDFEHINKCAYFDYQRHTVYARTNPKITLRKKRYRKRGTYRLNIPRLNKHIEIQSEECPNCKDAELYRHYSKPHIRRTLDLKISDRGIKRCITKYTAASHRCKGCKKTFVPPSLKTIETYGSNLKAWTVYQHIANRLCIETIRTLCRECFGLPVNYPEMYYFKSGLAKYYQSTYKQLLERIKAGSIIHADETQINLKKERGYVWVFANMEEIVFMYRPSREGKFLVDLFGGYNGVLISDFYAAYDSLSCLQQKCLAHLIRDMNQDVFKHPFDEELKEMAHRFGTLLRDIVDTVHKYGLQRRFLRRHCLGAARFFKYLEAKEYGSDVTKKYLKRFTRYKEKMFTFLNHDNVPWNNNNAEHAIKHFAAYRKEVNGKMSEKGIKDYLVLLSLYQTCKYKGISFLSFLLSQSRDIPHAKHYPLKSD